MTLGRWRIYLDFLWYDCWIGWYYDRVKGYHYVCPLPMVCFKIFKV